MKILNCFMLFLNKENLIFPKSLIDKLSIFSSPNPSQTINVIFRLDLAKDEVIL